MNGFTKIQSTHLKRQAVVYLRQSSQKQVLQNRESALNQRALRGRLLELGWKKEQISLIDEDQGMSAKQVSGRQGFQTLVADVGLGKVGIIMGYEASRLSRNCADWHRLLELCALFDTLIGDTDGLYNPRDFNDRLLLGLKGTMSEAELHSLRLRMDGGRLSKARRGDLVQHLPTGFVRVHDSGVMLDPNQGVRDRMGSIFIKFLELGSVQKVLRYFARHELKLPRRQTSGLYAGEVLWKDPSSSALYSILKNPAYAGAFAYGRRAADPTRQTPGRPSTGRLRRVQSEWMALVKDVYPAYITWEQFERIQGAIEENRQKMQDQFTPKRSIRRGAALLAGLVRCGRCGHAMGVAYKEGRFQYKCATAQNKYGKPSCQHLSGRPIDEAVTEEFFRVLHPAQIDALEKVNANQVEHHRELVQHLNQEVRRLEYEAGRAGRQYDCVDPENRMIAATLEKKWENALAELEQSKTRLAEVWQQGPAPVLIPQELRRCFANVGQRLPQLWPRLSLEAKKLLIRTLVCGVNLLKHPDGTVPIRIVWRGGVVSEKTIRLPVHSLRYSEIEKIVAQKIGCLAEEGLDNDRIAAQLNHEDFTPCRGDAFTRLIVIKLKRRFQIVSNYENARRGGLATAYTIREMARLIRIDPSWIYRKIGHGIIEMEKDPRYGCYLFPKEKQSIDAMNQLKEQELCHVSFPKVH